MGVQGSRMKLKTWCWHSQVTSLPERWRTAESRPGVRPGKAGVCPAAAVLCVYVFRFRTVTISHYNNYCYCYDEVVKLISAPVSVPVPFSYVTLILHRLYPVYQIKAVVINLVLEIGYNHRVSTWLQSSKNKETAVFYAYSLLASKLFFTVHCTVNLKRK